MSQPVPEKPMEASEVEEGLYVVTGARRPISDFFAPSPLFQEESESKSSTAKFVPLGEKIVVKAEDPEPTLKDDFNLPDSANEKPQEGTVVAVGPGRMTDEGSRVAMELKKGDRIIYSKFAGTEYKDGEDEYLILRESDILEKIAGSEDS